MKKVYCKPQVSIEGFIMDEPIALNCSADFDDVQSIIDLGFFGAGNDRNMKCDMDYTLDVDLGDTDTVCYHSNILKAFLS